jgi:ssDNA-binding Zn-finger/Zn-ribbon topoisomerase 1
MAQEVHCGECGSPMILKRTRKHLYESGLPRMFYSCSRFPICRGTCGAYPDGSPAGVPANTETKAQRRVTYETLEAFRISRKWNKRGMYSWLAKRLKMERDKCHVTNFDIETCKKVLAVIERAKETSL